MMEETFQKSGFELVRHKKRSTLDDVARLSGVSPITVSRALRKPDVVSPELQAKILGAVNKLSYVPNMAASRLASSRSHSVGVVVPTLYNVIFAEYLQAIHEVLVPSGYQVMVVNSRYSIEEEEQAVRSLLGQRVEAVIMVGVKHTNQTRLLLKRAQVPVIETFQLSDDPLGVNIGLNQFAAGRDATRLLLSSGVRNVSFIVGQLDVRAFERLEGYKLAMEEAGIGTEGLITAIDSPSCVALGSEIVRHIHGNGRMPEAFCCIDDNVALGALHECARLGARIPDDIQIMGFHDLEFAATARPSLSSVLTHRYRIGEIAASTAVRLIASGKAERDTINLGYEILRRESTAVAS
jgi:LacI family transcriptional regulator, gluconate utilization system Gnt-I transcriptional repressor